MVARLRHARLRALADALANNTKAPRIEPYLDADVPAHRVAMQRQMFASQLAEHRARLAALERTVAKGKAAYCQRNRD